MNTPTAETPNDEDLAFAETLALLEVAYRLARPDAPEMAHKIYRRYLSRAAAIDKSITRTLQNYMNLSETLNSMRAQGEFYSARAREVRRIMTQYDGKRVYPTEDPGGALPERIIKPARQDPILGMVQKGQLDTTHEYAARSIATCFEAAAREGMARIREYGLFMPPPKRSGRPTSSGMPDVLAERHAEVYLPWTREMHQRKTLDLPFVFDICVDGIALNTAATNRKMGWRKGLRILKESLELWGEFDAKARRKKEEAQRKKERKQ